MDYPCENHLGSSPVLLTGAAGEDGDDIDPAVLSASGRCRLRLKSPDLCLVNQRTQGRFSKPLCGPQFPSLRSGEDETDRRGRPLRLEETVPGNSLSQRRASQAAGGW